jgi:nucleotide-binding universal stress UspA family protein
MKNVLLLVHDDEGQEARFQAALDLGRALDGHISCVDVTPFPAEIGMGFPDGGALLATVLTDQQQVSAQNRTRMEERLRHEDVAWDWMMAAGDYASCLKGAAALADIIVVNCRIEGFEASSMQGAVSDLIVRSGKPIMAVPAHCERMDLSSALIAWDGSVQSAAALRAAVPLLRLSDRVTLLQANDGSIISPASDAARYLSRHGVHALVREVPSENAGAASAILREATEGGYGYIVMGGFGHLRLMQSLFGAVTRTMLTRSPLPLLLAH